MSKNKLPLLQKRGYPLPLGTTERSEGINFSIFCRHGTQVTLVIHFDDQPGSEENFLEFELSQKLNRTGDIWHILLEITTSAFTYGYRIDGDSDLRGRGSVFSPTNILIDPFSHMLSPRTWGTPAEYGNIPCCRLIQQNFNWRDDHPPKNPLTETIIYELHVRGFTQNPNSNVEHPGTYRGIIEKIPYLKDLGITAVELMPVVEFDENDTIFHNPETGEKLKNYWGYNPVSFFSLKSGYAASVQNHINEFKEMVLALHNAGLEVFLDMVYNHTGEGGYDGATSSFRGIGNSIYYLLDPLTKEYMNFSGCGNTMNCNHPVVRELIRKSLRYWVVEMHIDGFRFDLASILGRDKEGKVLPDPPMIELIAEDPVLRDTKIIAEAWDAAGLYQVGSFSNDARWGEWNGKFRDDIRGFFAGNQGLVTNLATRVAGSSDLYQSGNRGPCNSINFLTSHDGFTLYDLVSYNEKQNWINGENNRDGDNHNISWSSGFEGKGAPREIEALRFRRMKSMVITLMLSQGVPMITAGDEFGRSQSGNNNAWCQDNGLSWLDWSLLESNEAFFSFFKKCIHLRKSHTVFSRKEFFTVFDSSSNITNMQEIFWQGTHPKIPDWSPECHHLGFLLSGTILGQREDDDFFIMLNGNRQKSIIFTIPTIPEGDGSSAWYQIIDTSAKGSEDFNSLEYAKTIPQGSKISLAPMGAMVLQSQSIKQIRDQIYNK